MLYTVEPNILHFSCGMQKANTITKIIEEKLQWPKLYFLNASASTFIESCRCKIKNSEVKVMKKKDFHLVFMASSQPLSERSSISSSNYMATSTASYRLNMSTAH